MMNMYNVSVAMLEEVQIGFTANLELQAAACLGETKPEMSQTLNSFCSVDTEQSYSSPFTENLSK